MRIPKEVPLRPIAEETSYLEQQVESHTADQLRRLAILELHGSTRPESYPDPVRYTTRSLGAVLSDIDRASAERLAEMRQVEAEREGPEVRAERTARFAAQRMAECEAIRAALKPQAATRYQPPGYPSPFNAANAYYSLRCGLLNQRSDREKSQNLPDNITAYSQNISESPPHLANIDPTLRNPPMEVDVTGELDKADLYLCDDLTNSLPPSHENTSSPQSQATTMTAHTTFPAIPRRMSTLSTQTNSTLSTLSTTPSRSPTPSSPAKTLLEKHRVRRNSGQDTKTPRRGRGRPLGSGKKK